MSKSPRKLLEFPVKALPRRPIIAYVRKSSPGEDGQKFSPEQQLAAIKRAIEAERGPGDHIYEVFEDWQTGQTADRNRLQDAFNLCRHNMQPIDEPGEVWFFSRNRFGRFTRINAEGKKVTDWLAYDKARIAFEENGWNLRFTNKKTTGNPMADRITDTIDDEGSVQYIIQLTENVVRGQSASAIAGFWPRGVAPWPCLRQDYETKQVLKPQVRDPKTGAKLHEAERVQPHHHVVLTGDPEGVKHWKIAAKMLLDGEPILRIVRYFNQRVPTARRSTWDTKTVQTVLANEVLIGVLNRIVYESAGVPELRRIKAQWDPIVPLKLFRLVQVELANRAKINKKQRRREDSAYIIRGMRCASCGARYVGNVNWRTGVRYYKHPEVKFGHKTTRDIHDRAVAAGCRVFRVRADEAEAALCELILEQRGSAAWAATMRQLFEETSAFSKQSRDQVRFAQKAADDAEVTVRNNYAALDDCSDKRVRDKIMARILEKENLAQEARREVQVAQERQRNASGAWEHHRKRLEEAARIEAIFAGPDDAAKMRVLEWWIPDLAVAVQPVPAKTRQVRSERGVAPTVLQKVLLVTLATSPEETTQLVLPQTSRKREADTQELTTLDAVVAPGLLDQFFSKHRFSGPGATAQGFLIALPTMQRKRKEKAIIYAA